MKKIFAVLLVLAMVFSMAACGSEEPQEELEPPKDEQVEEEVLATLTETDKITLRGRDFELEAGETCSENWFDQRVEVLYEGETLSDSEYDFAVVGEDPSISATVWDEYSFLITGFKNGECDLVITCGEEKATFHWVMENIPEYLALDWEGAIIYGDSVYEESVFGMHMFDDDLVVRYGGEAITDYTFTVADESLAEVTKNADGTLHVKAKTTGEVIGFLTIEYNGTSDTFGLCTE